MKTTPKRPRSDSAKAAIAAAQAVALGPLSPPAFVRLSKQAAAFWDAIVTARPRDTWTTADLILAGNLARAYADIEQLQKTIDTEGFIVEGKAHPAIAIMENMSRRALATGRQLKVDTIATVGKAEDITKGAELERGAHRQGEDDLIPTMATLQ